MDTYELLDCGDGRKVERFASVRVVRPAPAATAPARAAAAWQDPDLEYVRDSANRAGKWIAHRSVPDPWIVTCAGLRFELSPTPAGQVGLFPEQEPLRERWAAWLRSRESESLSVLDLFGSTGGTSLAAAAAGATVTYVDGARAMVSRLRRNLEINGLVDASVRSITEDAARFVVREVRRRRRYRAIALDPPTFGRGPGGTAFHIERDLDALLAGVQRLLDDGPTVVMLSAHTESWTPSRLASHLDRACADRPGRTDCGELTMRAVTGATLASGVFAWRETS